MLTGTFQKGLKNELSSFSLAQQSCRLINLLSSDWQLLKRRPLQIFLHLALLSKESKNISFFCFSLINALCMTGYFLYYLIFFYFRRQMPSGNHYYPHSQVILIKSLIIPQEIEIMAHYDIKISKAAEQASKRRPSIELSPTLEKPVYIVTKNMNGRHILELVDCLEKEKIQYQMQQETSTLGFVLNQRFFVIVDNKYGQVTLGADFASILMTIVGYPRIGKNKKNKYLQKPSDIVKCYREFKTAPDPIKMSKSLIKSNEAVIGQQASSQLKGKIEVRSIIKYKSQDSKQSINSNNSLKQASKKESQRLKLIIMDDKENTDYTAICESLFANEKTKQMLEKVDSIEEIRKKTLFHTNKVKILYLTTNRHSKQLINTIFIGQVIIFSSQRDYKLNDMINEPKIYAIAYQKDQLLKILHKVGMEVDASRLFLNSKLDPSSTFSDSKNSPFLLKNESNVKQKEVIGLQSELMPPKSMVREVSKIDNNISVISEANEAQDLNASVISKSSSCSRKIKRLGKSKNKANNETKPNEAVAKESQLEAERKKTLKSINSDYIQPASKSKKNLTFKENLIEGNKIKRIKSISKVAPEVLTIQADSKSTMTEDQYCINVSKPKNISSGSNFFSRSQDSFLSAGKSSKMKLHGIFYRQFVPKFHNLAQIIKLNPSSLFCQNEKQVYIQSFVYVKEYDRFVRRLRNRMKELKQKIDEYNFVIILRDEDYPQFQQYCRAKNQTYNDEQADFSNTFKQNFSCLSSTSTKMNLHVFIESEMEVKSEKVTYGRIQILKYKLNRDVTDYNLSRTLSDLKLKVEGQLTIRNRDYICA